MGPAVDHSSIAGADAGEFDGFADGDGDKSGRITPAVTNHLQKAALASDTVDAWPADALWLSRMIPRFVAGFVTCCAITDLRCRRRPMGMKDWSRRRRPRWTLFCSI